MCARYKCSPAWPGPEDLGPEVFAGDGNGPSRKRKEKDKLVGNGNGYRVHHEPLHWQLARVFYVHRPSRRTPPTRLAGPYNNELPLPPTNLIPLRDRADRQRKGESPDVCSPESSARPPPPQQLMDLGRNAEAIRTSEKAKSSFSPRPSGSPFSAASFTPWFRELLVNASK